MCWKHFNGLCRIGLGELNIIYCLIYLDDLIVFQQTIEEHLHQLCIVFDRLREYNLQLKHQSAVFLRKR